VYRERIANDNDQSLEMYRLFDKQYTNGSLNEKNSEKVEYKGNNKI